MGEHLEVHKPKKERKITAEEKLNKYLSQQDTVIAQRLFEISKTNASKFVSAFEDAMALREAVSEIVGMNLWDIADDDEGVDKIEKIIKEKVNKLV